MSKDLILTSLFNLRFVSYRENDTLCSFQECQISRKNRDFKNHTLRVNVIAAEKFKIGNHCGFHFEKK